MAFLQKLIFFILFTFSWQVPAAWQVALDRAGFFGSLALGVIYEWSEKHSAEFATGVYQIEGQNYLQSALAYRYSLWKIEDVHLTWTPLQPGIFLVGSWDRDRYFVRSPDKYPYKDYYDETAIRGGFELGTVVHVKRAQIAAAYHLRLLDPGLLALYHNVHGEPESYLSSGFSVRFQF